MKFQKIISLILHPMVVPTIGVLLYLMLFPNVIQQNNRNYLLALIFFTTYIVPLVILILLKLFGIIKSFQLNTIKERKIPLFIMIFLFYILGNSLFQFRFFEDFALLFYATSFGLVAVYLFFMFKIKVSLHLLSMGIMVGFFISLSYKYVVSLLLIITICMLLSGFLASARLCLKAHTPKEVYLGFFFGLIAQCLTFYLL